MKVLIIGGTGNISLDVAKESLRRGWAVLVLNRGSNPDAPGCTRFGRTSGTWTARRERCVDTRETRSRVAFEPAHVEADLGLFRGKTRQYLFVLGVRVPQAASPPPDHGGDTTLRRRSPASNVSRVRTARKASR